MSYYLSHTYGKIDIEGLKDVISSFLKKEKKAKYEVIIGTDSQKIKNDRYDFINVLIIYKLGKGGIYFWKREIKNKKISFKERIYEEAIMSLQTAEEFVSFFKDNGISKYDIQIHVDIGLKGKTKELVNEVVGMIRGNGYQVKIKPESYGASKVADRHT